MNGKIIAVTGATGQQGGATARKLLSAGWKVRALTRDPNKPAAQQLAGMDAEIVRGDLDNPRELEAAFASASRIFSVQNYWLPDVGYDGEIRQGKNVADAAKATGVQHLVYSSVGAAHRGAGQKHFEFFNGEGYDADIPALRKIHPGLLTLEQWLRKNGWENAQPVPMQQQSGSR